MPGLCRDCHRSFADAAAARARCPACGSPRIVVHRSLEALAIAHVDCDAFYASVEKRDDPSLADKPVIIGGGRRGVVSTACYIARISGVRSAMPMFKALEACPDAVVIRPDMAKYAAVARQIRSLMEELTPLVQPISIDEAFLDLSGTERLHGAPPAVTLARFASRVEREIGITVSVGLSANRFLAKYASDFDKPRGFVVIDQEEAVERLADEPVSKLPGVGPAQERTLREAGFRLVRDLQQASEETLMRRLGAQGQRLGRLANGIDARRVDPSDGRKSVSAETTFESDIRDAATLLPILRRLSEKVSKRLKAQEIAGRTITLKLKTREFKLTTRSRQLPDATRLADRIYRTGADLLAREIDGRAFRLIGIGVSELETARNADPADLLEPERAKRAQAELAVDRLRGKFGDRSVELGLTFRPEGGERRKPAK
ncbi:DNA polymerase IV [Amorphus coralli]|uniref:DNA polymerase IV n=1 Tax=Amorphus coralli TaxID=340680 RepID=UPI00035E30B8|nr:DNA polymerase IV [Amorphus coralli]